MADFFGNNNQNQSVLDLAIQQRLQQQQPNTLAVPIDQGQVAQQGAPEQGGSFNKFINTPGISQALNAFGQAAIRSSAEGKGFGQGFAESLGASAQSIQDFRDRAAASQLASSRDARDAAIAARKVVVSEVEAGAKIEKSQAEVNKIEAELTRNSVGGLTSKEKRDGEKGLRGEFVGLSAEFIKVRDSFGRIQSAKESAAGDLSLVFNFMKMLDPGSVVRESEFATAQNAAGVPERIRNVFNRLNTGELLAPAQRADFIGQASDLFTSQNEIHENRINVFTGLASRNNLNPENVVIDVRGGIKRKEAQPTAAPETGGTMKFDAQGNLI